MAIPRRTLGKTKQKVTIFGLGGEGILRSIGHHAESQRVIEKAIDIGVSYFDTAPAYQQSRDYLGSVLPYKAKRENIVIASKTHDRSYEGSIALLEDTLKRLKTPYLDILQLHDLRDMNDIKQIFSSNGAIHALEEAKKSGKIKYMGITGHTDPQVLIAAIKKYNFDTVLLCTNAGDPHHLPFITTVIPEARKKNMGVIGMKVTAQGHAFPDITMKEAFYYTLSQDVDLAIIGCRTPQEVQENANLAELFKPLTSNEIKAIEQKTATNLKNTNFFKKGMF